MTDFFDEMLDPAGAGDAVKVRDPYADYGRWFDR